jgi:atypical dual specificity phosphatase
MSKIVHTDAIKLYLGDIFDANDEVTLNERRIQSIICVAGDVCVKLNPSRFVIYKYDLQDTHECNISVYFDEIADLIHNQKAAVLVNCFAGVSRSASFVIAYLMKYYDMDLRSAFLYVRNRRNQICPNKQFMTYLHEYEFKLFGVNSITYEECVRLFYYT